MGATGLNQLDAKLGRLKATSSLPLTVDQYYGDSINIKYWQGGEVVYNLGDDKLYIQTATSGTTPTWKRVVTAFATY